MQPMALTASSNSAFSKLNSSEGQPRDNPSPNSREKMEIMSEKGIHRDHNSPSNSTSPHSSHPPSSSPPSSLPSPPVQKHVLKFSVDSIMSAKKCPTPTSPDDRLTNDSPHSMSSDDSCAESPRLPCPPMGQFSMEGILNKHSGLLRTSDNGSSPALMPHVPGDSRGWPGFYTSTSFPWIPGTGLSPPKGKYKDYRNI